jgi:TolB protein
MKSYSVKSIFVCSIVIITSFACRNNDDEPGLTVRLDDAEQLTFSQKGESAQNPAFSPDGKYILFTRFKNGYNEPPSELVKININKKEETVIVPAQKDVEHISVPGTSWINGKICWSSDLAGQSNEIYVANDDGTEMRQITNHPESAGYYIEPVFNPLNTSKIIFEFGKSDDTPHQIVLVESDKNNKVTFLTNDSHFDDRLPNWSYDGQKILFQRASAGGENWQIYIAEIDFTGIDPKLKEVTKISQPSFSNTDNSWYWNNSYILSSTKYDSEMPNIFAFPVNTGNPIRITNTNTNEDGAPSCSPDGKQIAFETHFGEDEEFPSEIWIIKIPSTLK